MKAYYILTLLTGLILSVIGIIMIYKWVCCLVGLSDLEMIEKIFLLFLPTMFILVGVRLLVEVKNGGE